MSGHAIQDVLSAGVARKRYRVATMLFPDKPAPHIDVEIVLDGPGSLEAGREASTVQTVTDRDGVVAFDWHRWPLNLSGDLNATLLATCPADHFRIVISEL
jgi:hypothetical protein